MNLTIGLLLFSGGLTAGLLAGLLGIGGGTVLVPILVSLNYSYDQSVATSSLAIVMTSIAGTIQNWRLGFLNPQKVIGLGLPAILTAQIGVYLVKIFPTFIKEGSFGVLLVITIFLMDWRKKLIAKIDREAKPTIKINPIIARIGTGGAAGILAGLFGIGGGVIMVPLQMLLLKEEIKTAIQTSLGVIVMTAIAACWGHAQAGNVQWLTGCIVGTGGLIGALISTRFLPKLPDRVVNVCFRTLLILLAAYFFIRAIYSYH